MLLVIGFGWKDSDAGTSSFPEVRHAGPSGAILPSLPANAQLCHVFSVPCCLPLDGLLKETIQYTHVRFIKPLRDNKKVMVDHLQSRGTPWCHCTNHVEVLHTLSKMDVPTHL